MRCNWNVFHFKDALRLHLLSRKLMQPQSFLNVKPSKRAMRTNMHDLLNNRHKAPVHSAMASSLHKQGRKNYVGKGNSPNMN
eukprot:1161727-Pelagomonas_calceolata.AAC.6